MPTSQSDKIIEWIVEKRLTALVQIIEICSFIISGFVLGIGEFFYSLVALCVGMFFAFLASESILLRNQMKGGKK